MKLNTEIIFKNEVVDVFLNIINFKHKIKLIVLKTCWNCWMKLVGIVVGKRRLFLKMKFWAFFKCWKIIRVMLGALNLFSTESSDPKLLSFWRELTGSFTRRQFCELDLKDSWRGLKNSAWSLKWLVEVTRYRCTAACVGVFHAVRYCYFCRIPA